MVGDVNSERVVIVVPVKLRAQLEKAARKEEVSMSQIARRALRTFFEQCKTAST